MSTTSLADPVAMPADPEPVAEETGSPAAAQAQLPRHPLVFVGLIGLPLLSFAALGFTEAAVVAAFTAAVLTALTAIDIEYRVLPNQIVLPAIVAVLAAQIAFFPERALEWPLAGLAAAAFLALPLILRRDAMGMGDIKLAVLLGAATGWSVFGAIVIGCLAIIPVAGWMLLRNRSIKGATLPFGPFLAFGTLVILFTS